MEHFKNKAESVFREIRSVEIFRSTDISYQDNLDRVFPTIDPLYKFDIASETYSRKLLTKTKTGNYLYDIDLGFTVLDLDETTIAKCYEYFNKKGFAIVMYSNVDRQMLGNDREPLTIEFIDGKKEDGSGSDDCNISITGKTILPPIPKSI